MATDQPPESEPDWSLLPHDPVSFFELEAGYDRKDLKRSYNRLLRLYKPEKRPAEFQRIRAAYEDLERRLRYGDARAATGEANWTAPERHAPAPRREEAGQVDPPRDKPSQHDPDRDHSSKSDADRNGGEETAMPRTDGGSSDGDSADTPRGETPTRAAGRADEIDEVVAEAINLEALAARLEAGDESLPAAYDRLAKKRHKTPPDFYALALIGDATEPPEQLLLLRWLLKGLQAWPGDSALSQLVYGYLRTQAPTETLPALLVLISKTITNDGFYRLTEGAWERLLRERPFEAFAETLQRCEANIAAGAGGDPAIGGRVAFYLFALRYALWKDTGDWKDRALVFVEEHFDQMPEQLVNDLDGLMILREYLAHRAEFVAAHPLRARLDAVLEAAYTQDQLEIDRRMAECQREILASPATVAEAFPAADSPACRSFYPQWAWISEDAASRLAPAAEESTDYRLWKGRVIELLTAIKEKSSWHSTYWTVAQFLRNTMPIIGIITFAVVTYFVIFLGPLLLLESLERETYPVAGVYWGLFAILPTTLLGIWVWRWLSKNIDEHIWRPYCRRMAERCYLRIWRPQAFDFLRRSALDFFTFRELVAQAAAEAPPDERTWASHFIQQDFGLAVYSIAQRFRE